MNAPSSPLPAAILHAHAMCADAMQNALYAAMQAELGHLMAALVSDLPAEAHRGLQADAARLIQRFALAWTWAAAQGEVASSPASQSSAA